MDPKLYVQTFYRDDDHRDVACTVYKRNGVYKVEIPDTLDVIYRDNEVAMKVFIELETTYALIKPRGKRNLLYAG